MATQLKSDRVVMANRNSVRGKVQRAWKLSRVGSQWSPWWAWLPVRACFFVLAACLVVLMGVLAVAWNALAYTIFLPFTWLHRRGERRRRGDKLEQQRHREVVAAIERAKR